MNTPPTIGPVLSGLLLMRWGWRCIFFFLVISASACLLCLAVFLPETCRNVVGDGTAVGRMVHRPLVPILTAPKQAEATTQPPVVESSCPTGGVVAASSSVLIRTLKSSNPIACLALLRNPSTLIVTACFGMFYLIYSSLQASLSSLFVQNYHTSNLETGLTYIPFGVAVATASFCAGMHKVPFSFIYSFFFFFSAECGS